MKRIQVAVVGAGISGLVCAYELQKMGYEVTVYEKEPYVGGRMSTRRRDGLTFDIGANLIERKYSLIDHYCTEMRVPIKDMSLGIHRLLKHSKYYRLNLSMLRLAGTRLLSWKEKIRMFGLMLRVRFTHPTLSLYNLYHANPSLDSESAYAYLKRSIGKRFVDYVADPVIAAYHFHSSKESSKAFFYSILTTYDQRSLSLKYVTGGMGSLPEAISRRVSVKNGASVKKVWREGRTVYVESGGKRAYDVVVIATTADVARRVIIKKSRNQNAFLDKVKYATTVYVSFKVPEDALGGVYLSYLPKMESPIICEYSNESRKGSYSYKGHSLINVGLHEDFAKTLIKKSNGLIFKLVKSELLRVCPELVGVKAEVVPFDLVRWERAVPKFYPGYVRAMQHFWTNGQGDNSIYLVGDYLNSTGVESAARCGKRVAEMILGEYI
ncbi:FAD-dependent oxidoreductase [Candidatus Woesearchaeota archaeon]|nr:FAD-dependent oxidoreductase [Candidatus Woesearchaeota archaeon]